MAIGFDIEHFWPARTESTIVNQCQWSGVPIITISIFGSSDSFDNLYICFRATLPRFLKRRLLFARSKQDWRHQPGATQITGGILRCAFHVGTTHSFTAYWRRSEVDLRRDSPSKTAENQRCQLEACSYPLQWSIVFCINFLLEDIFRC